MQYAIGIDPDIKKSGYAIWDRRERKFVDIGALPFFELITKLQLWKERAKITLESNHKIPFVWTRKGGYKSPKIARDVGRNHAIGELLESYLLSNGYECEFPLKQSSKWDKDMFYKFTGIKCEGEFAQEMVDAGTLVIGR